ncbi:S8 family peptidase [Mycobacterium sp. SMC-2]|uniref:S8 family peptidase n=1 Tax=Mycobacterium TaxID=1763 RepID=UPI001CE1644A|nr:MULTISPECIES: S8 family peptidase [Mycobacterium]MCA4761175.1 S8 family peptidase [Mycobacterium avium subsp. hominissuis]UXA06492.1 S8 family peptidase [Mycobacterium sp. SMC-2]
MANRDRSHILIPGLAQSEAYRAPARAIGSPHRTPPSDRRRHGEQLASELQDAAVKGHDRRSEEQIEIPNAIDGVYVRFDAFEGLEDVLESLDPRQGRTRPELRAFRTTLVEGQLVEQAVVFIPDGKLGYFLKRIEQYLATVDYDNPRNARLVDRIQSIGLASLEQLWTDSGEFPSGADAVWWEVWLRRRDGDEMARLRQFGDAAGVEVGAEALGFSDRVVVLVRATANQLSRALDVLDDIAELRRPGEPAGLIALEDATDQAQWTEQLADRTSTAPSGSPAACVVDTGVHRTHPLLAPSLDIADCHTCDPNWGIHDSFGHGTEMAGLALFGDVGAAVVSGEPINLRHRLESVKLLPRPNVNPPHLWGALTATAASLVEIQAPARRRVFGMAVSAPPDSPAGSQAPQLVVGQPSSWSAAVDALAAGLGVALTEDGMVFLNEEEADRERRLFLVAAGNIDSFEDDYLNRSDTEPIEDPGQSWNALTIGAFTEAETIDANEIGYDGWTTLAPHGELSPYSRTSVPFHRQWPVKPEVVLEGGNVARSPDGTTYDWPYSLQSLTTKAPLKDSRLLTVTRQTSAATARATHLAASILAEYPGLWAETVRGLMVHSAEWTEPMRAKLNAATTRQARLALFRRYGMGVPDLTRATRSATDALTLIAEDVIRPFDGNGRMREMNLHVLPWPTDVLSDLGEAEVTMRVTLSYFVDPNPSRRGWQRRYRYASHGLRFEARRATESIDDFRKRINALALAEEERRRTVHSDSDEWYFGPNQRAAGSLHTDIWTGTAADLASRGALAIYPVTGWWKERPDRDRSNEGARYSLIISIETPGQDVDIWTPVAAEVGIPVTVEV